MNRYILLLLSVAGGISCGMAWMDWSSGLLLLFGFIPFLLIEDHMYENRQRYPANVLFSYLLPGFLIFCILALSWIRVVSLIAAIMVITGTTFMMTFTFWLFHIIRLKAGNVTGYLSFIVFWLTYELLCLKIDLITPWINLGNGLAREIVFIQWYEITGAAGGSLWILLSNLLLFLFLSASLNERKNRLFLFAIWISVIIIPVTISLTRFNNIKPSRGNESEVVIIQPNVDPFYEKFTIPFEEQLSEIVEMVKQNITAGSVWIVTPETTIDDPVDENDIENNRYVKMLRSSIENFPGTDFVTGMVSYRSEADKGKTYYNSALKIGSTGPIEVYHKSKLVPGFEMVPPNRLTALIRGILPRLGGTEWGYGVQDDRNCFESSTNRQIIAPVICYESVYGEFVTDYIKKGAEAIFIITNDGWWKESQGYKQHLSFSSLRAIETRRPVVRAANTGISCFIDIKGKIVQRSEWWTKETLTGKITSEERITPYVKYGDYILNTAGLITILILLSVFVYRPFSRKRF